MDKMALAEYMKLPYKLEIVADPTEGGYVASYPELPGCVTCADTIEDLILHAKDAKKAWLEAAMEEGITIPQPTKDDKYSGQFKLRLPKSLHRLLAEQSKQEGISMNQYCVYLLAQNNALHSKV